MEHADETMESRAARRIMTDGMLWGGRFETGPDPEMLGLTASVDVDMQLLPYDLEVTKAHARSLLEAGILDADVIGGIDDACDEIAQAWAEGALVLGPDDEDVHSVVERALTERLGDVGRSIHAGRSRNDLVATDLRLWCRAAGHELVTDLDSAIDALCAVASDHLETVMPGYTHLQRAQPVTLAYHLIAHGFALLRDKGRVLAAVGAADVSPLGAGALAGTTLPLDPGVAAQHLGFGRVFSNAMDAVSDRDFAADLVYACTMIGAHLSRLAEEVVLWTSSEFGFARLADQWSTGSSMMPQKRNPDLAELTRGRAGTLIGDLTAFLALLKGLPLAYDRDLQEDKAIVFRAVATARRVIAASSRVVEALAFDKERLSQAAGSSGTWATDVAETLVTRGVPFRTAHAAAGELVARLEEEGIELGGAPAELLASVHGSLRSEDTELADPRRAVEARSIRGGPAAARVREQIAELREATGIA